MWNSKKVQVAAVRGGGKEWKPLRPKRYLYIQHVSPWALNYAYVGCMSSFLHVYNLYVHTMYGNDYVPLTLQTVVRVIFLESQVDLAYSLVQN